MTREAETPQVQTWLAGQTHDELAISDWVMAEFSAALSIKLREGKITTDERAGALALFNKLTAESFTLLPVASLHFLTAARFADQHLMGLRAGDALHLAICANYGATLCTLDKRLHDASGHFAVHSIRP